MGMIETVYLFKGDSRIRVNRGDEARFEADGWKPKATEPADKEPADKEPADSKPPKGSGKKG
jgi:hypothetical protein